MDQISFTTLTVAILVTMIQKHYSKQDDNAHTITRSITHLARREDIKKNKKPLQLEKRVLANRNTKENTAYAPPETKFTPRSCSSGASQKLRVWSKLNGIGIADAGLL